MAKGFVFTLDAAFAILVLAILLATFAFFSSQAEENPYPLIILKMQANDVLIVMDKSGDLGSRNITTINASMQETLTPTLNRHMEIEYYNYSKKFHYLETVDFGSNYSGIEELVLAEREFLVFENDTVAYYGIARLRVWP
jgi:hypothetical protein